MNKPSAKVLCEKAGIDWQEAADAIALAEQLASSIAQLLQQQIEFSGSASLVVSGGSTPAPVFERLAQAAVDWSRVSVTLADERWVPPGHADSNESLVRDTLLVGNASVASFVPLYRDGIAAEDAIASVADDVAKMAQPFTVTILGMGGDGHTASLFPDAPAEELRVAMELNNESSVAILHPPSVPQVRITLTRSALLSSRYRILHFTGDTKQQVLADALAQSACGGDRPGLYIPGHKPIIGLLTSKPELASVYWSK